VTKGYCPTNGSTHDARRAKNVGKTLEKNQIVDRGQGGKGTIKKKKRGQRGKRRGEPYNTSRNNLRGAKSKLRGVIGWEGKGGVIRQCRNEVTVKGAQEVGDSPVVGEGGELKRGWGGWGLTTSVNQLGEILENPQFLKLKKVSGKK